jgi:ATP-dependent Zn protease
MTDNRETREGAAYHEAGHAVAGLLLERKFHHATIVQSDPVLGHVQYYAWPKGFSPDTNLSPTMRLRLQSAAICCLAGEAAERNFFGLTDDATPLNDASEKDRRAAAGYSEFIAGYGEALNAYMYWLSVRSRELIKLPMNWTQIDSVAKALLEQKTIDYKLVKQIANEAVQAMLVEKKVIKPPIRVIK